MIANSNATRRGLFFGVLSIAFLAFLLSSSAVHTAATNLVLKRTAPITGLKFAAESVSYSIFPLAFQISGLEARAEGERIVRIDSTFGTFRHVNLSKTDFALSHVRVTGIKISANEMFTDSLAQFLRQSGPGSNETPWILTIENGTLEDIQILGISPDSTAYIAGKAVTCNAVEISESTSFGKIEGLDWLFQPRNTRNVFKEPFHVDSLTASWNTGISKQFTLAAATNFGFLKGAYSESDSLAESSIEFKPDTVAWPLDASAIWVHHLKSLLADQTFVGSAEIDSVGQLRGNLDWKGRTVIPFEWNRMEWTSGPFHVDMREVAWAPIETAVRKLTWLHRDLNWLVEVNGSTEGLELSLRPVQPTPERIQIVWNPNGPSHEIQLNIREFAVNQRDGMRLPNRISAEAEFTVNPNEAQGQLRFLEGSESIASSDIQVDWDSIRWAYQAGWTLTGLHALANQSAWELFAALNIRGSGNWTGDWTHIAESRNIRLMENRMPRSFERFDLIHEKTGSDWHLNWNSDLSNGQFQANTEALRRWGLLNETQAKVDSSALPLAQFNATFPGFNTIAFLLGIPIQTKGIASIQANWRDSHQSINLDIPSLAWESLTAEDLQLEASIGNWNSDSIQWYVADIGYNGQPKCSNFEGTLTGNTSLGGKATWITSDHNQQGTLNLNIASSDEYWAIRLDSLFFPLAMESLTLDQPANFTWNMQEGALNLDRLQLSNSNGGWASGSGVLSPSGDVKANFDFRLNALPATLAAFDPTLQIANITGELSLIGNLHEPEFAADIQLGRWQWQGFEGQNSKFVGFGLLEKPHLIFSTELPPNGTMRVEADLPIQNPADWAAEVRLNQFALQTINRWLPDESIAVLGAADARVWLEDFRGFPKMRGNLTTFGTQLAVPYLGTVYDVEGRVSIEPGAFYLDQWRIRDDLGSEALFNGTVLHDEFQNWDLDFGIDATKERLRLMDIAPAEDAYFFGEARCTGDINISGYGKNLSIDASLTAGEGTQFSLPLDGTSDVSYADFIRFAGDIESPHEPLKPASAFSDISLNLGIDVLPGAEARIVFNRDVGDEIVGHAQGHLDLSIDDFERIRLNGALEIVDGIYYFTLQNWLSKRFDIEPGGTLVWEGDPYRADIDLSTIYSTRARLNPLFPDITDLPGRVPVDLKLGMTGSLMRPEVAFDIAVPNADSRVQALLEDALINEEEKQRQALSLLVMNQFFSMDPMAASIGGFLNTGQSTQLIANQLGHWISQISPGVDVGLDYEQNALSGEQALGLALSTQLWNDRLHIEGAVGMQSVGQIEPSDMQLQDLTISFDLIPDGTLQLTGHSRQNQALSNSLEGNQTQGVGIRFKRDFDDWRDWKSKSN